MNTIKKILIFAGLALVVPLSVSAMESKESDQTASEQQIQEIVKGMADVKIPSEFVGKPFYPELDNVEKAEALRRVIGQYLFDPATQSVRQNSTFIQQIKSLIDINSTNLKYNVFSERYDVFSVRSVAFSPDGETLASGYPLGIIKLWDTKKNTLIATLPGHTETVYSVAFSPDGKTLASGSLDKTIKLWDVSSKQLNATLPGHTEKVYSVVFSPDGKILASGSDDSIKLWDVSSKQPIATINSHTRPVLSVAFSPDGKTLASGSVDNIINLWGVSSKKLIDTINAHSLQSSVVFSPDGENSCFWIGGHY